MSIENTMKVLFLIIILIANMAFAGTYWVDDNGTVTTWANCESSSQISGTSACTVDTANANANDDDLVYFNDGEYNERIVPANSGSSGHPITFKSYNYLGAIIDGTGVSLATSTTGLVHVYNKDYITIDGFEIRNSVHGLFVSAYSDNTIVQNCKIHTSSSSYSVNNILYFLSNDGLIQYNEVYDAPWNGIAPLSTTNVDVMYNYIHDIDHHAAINVFPITSYDPQPMYYGNDVIGNYIEGEGHTAGGAMIYIRYNDDQIIAYNIVIGDTDPPLDMVGLTFDYARVENEYTYTASNIKVYNNIFTRIQRGARDYNVDGIEWKNNIFYNNEIYDLYIASAVDDHHIVDYNCWYPRSAHTLAGSHKLEDNPDFTSLSDFTLTEDSPCINSGENLGAAFDDGLDPDAILTSPQNGYATFAQGDHGTGWEIGAFVFEDAEEPPIPPYSGLVFN
jgi:hypothetical protein